MQWYQRRVHGETATASVRRLTMREKTLRFLSALVLLVGSAVAMPGDIEEEGFCIDGDVVAGFCLGANYAEKVQSTEGTCRTFCEEYRKNAKNGGDAADDRGAFFRDFTLLQIGNYVSCEDQCLFEMFGFGNHTDGSINVAAVEEFLDMTETGHNMDENNIPENCMEASADVDYRDFFNFCADQAGRRYYTEEMLENAYNRLSEEDKIKLNGVVSQMSFHECIKEEWSRECERTVNRFVANAAMPAGR